MGCLFCPQDVDEPVAAAPASQRTFIGISALVFAASAAVTIAWCGSMADMGGMTMPGNWTMSMAWMRMPGQSWPGAAAMFIAMWAVMMVAMMLPAIAPMLWRYRVTAGAVDARCVGWLTALVAIAYFFVWVLVGAAIFPLGTLLATAEMEVPTLARLVPIAGGAAILIAGALQFTRWKAHHLACCRSMPGHRVVEANAAGAVRHGLSLGYHCVLCCANLTAILLVVGVMDVSAMIAITAAIAVERLAAKGERFARATGAIAMIAGLYLIAQAIP